MKARLCCEIHSGLLSLAQHDSAVDHGMAGSYANLPLHPDMIDRGLLSQEQRKCTVDHREAAPLRARG